MKYVNVNFKIRFLQDRHISMSASSVSMETSQSEAEGKLQRACKGKRYRELFESGLKPGRKERRVSVKDSMLYFSV